MSVSRLRPTWLSVPYLADDTAVGMVGFLLVYAYLLRDITLGQVYAFGDLAPFYGMRAVAKFGTVWHEGGLGFAYDFHALPAYFGVVTLLGEGVGMLTGGVVDGGALAGNLFYLALIPVGVLGMLRFSKRYLRTVPARYLAAGCYALNPVVVAEFVNGGATTLLVFAGLPFVLEFLWRVVETDSWWPALLAGVAFGIVAVSPWIAFWMVAPFAALLAYRTRHARTRLLKLVAAGGLGVALSVPGLYHTLQRANAFDGGRDLLEFSLQYNYGEATLVPLLRLAGNQGTLAMNAFGYNDPAAYLVGLVVPAVALLAWHRRDLHGFFLVAGALVAFMLATHQGYTHPLFEAFAPLYSVRNPTKLQFPLVFAVALLFGAGSETLTRFARRLLGALRPNIDTDRARRRTRLAVGIGLLLVLLAYTGPASGAFGLEAVRGEDYHVTDEQAAVAERLDGRVLWVPYGYDTQMVLRHVYPSHVGVRSGGALQGIQNVDHVTQLFREFADDPGSVGGQLDSLGVEYVVVSADPPWRIGSGEPRLVTRYGAPWLDGDPAAYERLLEDSARFERAFTTENHAAYRVVGVDDGPTTQGARGVHAIYYPRSQEQFIDPGTNLLDNGAFDHGLDSWWAGGFDTAYSVVRSAEGFGERAVRIEGEGGAPTPISQSVAVADGPLRLDVATEDPISVTLVWYNGTRSAANRTATTAYTDADLPAVVDPRESSVSVRVRPTGEQATIDNVTLTSALHPPETGYIDNTVDVPGVTVDGWARPNATATTVAVNLEPWKAEQIGADVRVVDAETRLGGRLVYNDTYRQGVGVALENSTLPPAFPEDAQPVLRVGPDGPVLDYWVEGEFDDTPAAVHRTSYHEGWRAPDSRAHLPADGWANAFVGASTGGVHWAGGPVRLVALAWLVVWGVTLAVIARTLLRRRQ